MALVTTKTKAGGTAARTAAVSAAAPPPPAAAPPRQAAPPAATTAPPPAATPPAAAGAVVPARVWTYAEWWQYAKATFLSMLLVEKRPPSTVLYLYADAAAERSIPTQVGQQVWNALLQMYRDAAPPAAAPPAAPAAVAPAPAPPAAPAAVAPAPAPPAAPAAVAPAPAPPVTIEVIPDGGNQVKGKRTFDDPLEGPPAPIATPKAPEPANRPPTTTGTRPRQTYDDPSNTRPEPTPTDKPSEPGTLAHPLDPPAAPVQASTPGSNAFKVNGVNVMVKPAQEATVYFLFRVAKNTRGVTLEDPRDGSLRAATFADIAVWGVMMGVPRPGGNFLLREPTEAELAVISAEFNQGQTEKDQTTQDARKVNPLLMLGGLYLALRG